MRLRQPARTLQSVDTCRTLENLFDAKLTSYAQLASAIGRPGHDVEADGAPSRCADLEMELEELLEKVSPHIRLLQYTCLPKPILLTFPRPLTSTYPNRIPFS